MNNPNQPKVSIIIVHYNGIKILENCLNSLKNTNYKNYEVIVVDNNSSDESVDFIKNNYLNYLSLIQNKENLGFAVGNNVALKTVKSDYVVLLNNDTEVEENWLNELVKIAESDSSIGALQPKLLSLKNPKFFDYSGAAGGYLDRYGYAICRGRVFDSIEKDTGQYNDMVEIFWAGGAAIFLRNKVLSETGLLDEDFYAHFEEIDLCWRIHLKGYKIMNVPASVVYHLSGGTPNPKKLFLNHRNSLLTLLKNYSFENLCIYFPIRLGFEFITLAYAVSKNDIKWVGAIVRSQIWIFMHISLIMQKRRETQKLRVISDDMLSNIIFKKSIVISYFLRGKKVWNLI